MEEIPDARSPRHQDTDPGERLKKLDVVQKSRTKPIGSVGVVGSNVIENNLKID